MIVIGVFLGVLAYLSVVVACVLFLMAVVLSGVKHNLPWCVILPLVLVLFSAEVTLLSWLVGSPSDLVRSVAGWVS